MSSKDRVRRGWATVLLLALVGVGFALFTTLTWQQTQITMIATSNGFQKSVDNLIEAGRYDYAEQVCRAALDVESEAAPPDWLANLLMAKAVARAGRSDEVRDLLRDVTYLWRESHWVASEESRTALEEIALSLGNQLLKDGCTVEALDAFSLGCVDSSEPVDFLHRLGRTHRSGPLANVWDEKVYATIEDFEFGKHGLPKMWVDESGNEATIDVAFEKAYRGERSALIDFGGMRLAGRRWYAMAVWIRLSEGNLGVRCFLNAESVKGNELIVLLWFPANGKSLTVRSSGAVDVGRGWTELSVGGDALQKRLQMARRDGWDADNCRIVKLGIIGDELEGRVYLDSIELYIP